MRSRLQCVAVAVVFLCVGAVHAVAQDVVLAPGFDNDAWAQAAGLQPGDDALLASLAAPLSMPAEMARFLAVGGRDAAACNGPYTCPSPKSCGSWSAAYDCDDPYCGGDSFCDAKGAPSWQQPTQKFRYCTLGNGSGCYEYSVPNVRRVHCGCI